MREVNRILAVCLLVILLFGGYQWGSDYLFSQPAQQSKVVVGSDNSQNQQATLNEHASYSKSTQTINSPTNQIKLIKYARITDFLEKPAIVVLYEFSNKTHRSELPSQVFNRSVVIAQNNVTGYEVNLADADLTNKQTTSLLHNYWENANFKTEQVNQLQCAQVFRLESNTNPVTIRINGKAIKNIHPADLAEVTA